MVIFAWDIKYRFVECISILQDAETSIRHVKAHNLLISYIHYLFTFTNTIFVGHCDHSDKSFIQISQFKPVSSDYRSLGQRADALFCKFPT